MKYRIIRTFDARSNSDWFIVQTKSFLFWKDDASFSSHERSAQHINYLQSLSKLGVFLK